jgi:hypothetical protein
MSATLTLTAGSGPATIASSDPGAAYLFSPVTNGWPVSSASCAATLRCLIVDDSPRFLDAARGLLERQGIRVVGVASTRSDSVSGRLRAHVITAMHSSADERALVRAAFVGFAPAYRSARRTAVVICAP